MIGSNDMLLHYPYFWVKWIIYINLSENIGQVG